MTEKAIPSLSASAAMERIYGFLVGTERGTKLYQEWCIAREALDILADYKQIVNRLASAAATLADPESDQAKLLARKEVMDCVMKLQTIRSDM